MKHGVAFRKLNRTTSHRMLMLRNMVSSLFEHEQIKTTLPKAKEAARLAEKIITLGKHNTPKSYSQATAFLLKPALLPKLFTTLRERYADRPGGYTRIHKFGNRPGDNAPNAILELVDSPRDLKFEMVSRTVGAELLQMRVKNEGGYPEDGVKKVNLDGVEMDKLGWMRKYTVNNFRKALRFRGQDGKDLMGRKVAHYMNELIATPLARMDHQEKMRVRYKALEAKAQDQDKDPNIAPQDRVRVPAIRPVRATHRAGQRPVGLGLRTGLGLSAGGDLFTPNQRAVKMAGQSPLSIAKGALSRGEKDRVKNYTKVKMEKRSRKWADDWREQGIVEENLKHRHAELQH